jgi:hypothetical protein
MKGEFQDLIEYVERCTGDQHAKECPREIEEQFYEFCSMVEIQQEPCRKKAKQYEN